MKKMMTLFSILTISSTVFAKNIECNISILKAASGGLMPAEKTITLKETPIQGNRLDLAKCSTTIVSDLKLSLCGIEDSEAIGVFNAELMLDENSTQEPDAFAFTSAGALFANSKKGEGKLVRLNSQAALSPVFVKKMHAAKLDFTDYKGGDSLQIDEDVAAAFKKGVLTDSDIVSISIESCRIK